MYLNTTKNINQTCKDYSNTPNSYFFITNTKYICHSVQANKYIIYIYMQKRQKCTGDIIQILAYV